MSEQTKSAIERAKEYGIDVTLLESSLKLTVDQRVQRLQEWVLFQEEIRRAREKLYGKEIADEIEKLQKKWRRGRQFHRGTRSPTE